MTACLALLLALALPQHAAVAGELRLHQLDSHIFGNTRTLRVLVPAGYDAPKNRGRRYPILYLNDGQNLFDSATSVFNPMEWKVDETVANLLRAGRIAPLIVVGIDNAGRRERIHEYFPWVDEFLSPPDPNPQGSRYPAFLIDEVVPFIEARYRASTDARDRGIGGSSAGGLAALYAVIKRPGVFGRLLIESPSIYVDDAHILREAKVAGTWPDRIYLGAGTNESGRAGCDPTATSQGEVADDIRRLERLLLDAKVTPARIKVLIIPCAVHNERAWAERFPEALAFLYGATRRGR